MKCGDKVQVKDLAKVEASFRGRLGTVTADSRSGDVVVVEFADKADTRAFNADELGQVARKTPVSKASTSKASTSKARAFKAHASK
jgi:hypothetical protein